MKKITILIFILIFLGQFNIVKAEKEIRLLDSQQEEIANVKFLFCTDASCSKEKKNFTVGDSVFINYKPQYNVSLVAIIKNNKQVKNDIIKLPGFYVFKSEGEYNIKFKSLSSDFNEIDYQKSIIVQKNNKINKDTQVNKISQKNIKNNYFVFNKLIFIFLIFLIVFIMFLSYYFLIRKKSN